MKRTIIIAEAGVNHNGDLETAKKMIDIAEECGADYVKFQTADIDSLVIDKAPLANYQRENLMSDCSQKEMISQLMLPFEAFDVLANYCREKRIDFLSTPFDINSIRFLNNIVNVWKIPSGEITNVPYLVEIAKTNKEVFLSTGMSSLDEVDFAYKILRENGSGKITILHCTTQYPAPIDEINLNAMLTMKDFFHSEVGYSDHTVGIEIALAAVAMGATVIEKHFTLDRNMNGPDHKASIEPNELKRMISAIRNIEMAKGDGDKRISLSEKQNIAVVRKSIVANKRINKGEIFTEDNLTTKRPGNGISPVYWNEIIGTKAIKDFEYDEFIEV